MRNQYFRKVMFLFLIVALILPISIAGAAPREPVTLQFSMLVMLAGQHTSLLIGKWIDYLTPTP